MIVKDKHLLSLKDMNQSDELEQLLDAGASSFKIEGRLKDVSYVKNVTAAYRQKLDAIFARRPEYVRASSGTCNFEFKPQLDKSFSRESPSQSPSPRPTTWECRKRKSLCHVHAGNNA